MQPGELELWRAECAERRRLRVEWEREGAAGDRAAGPVEPEPEAPRGLLAFLQERRGMDDDTFHAALARAVGWPFLPKPPVPAEDEVKERLELQGLLSPKVARQFHVLPVKREPDPADPEQKPRYWFVTSNPFDPTLQAAVRFEVGFEPEFALATPEDVDNGLDSVYGVGSEALLGVARDEAEPEDATSKDVDVDDKEASVIKFVNQVILEAQRRRATDIHFEPQERELRIRYRVDGMLERAKVPDNLKDYQSAILSRIKVMAKMNIAEKRLPQDGRINVRIGGQEIDIRVSTVPTVYGESISLRLLTRDRKKITLESLGYPPQERRIVESIIVKPHGIFLVTGPTGSGKSTTLYACLQMINVPTKRILTVEDPVEYEIEGINQIAIRPEIGLTFATGLRHILRQDPNVVMVGEIRDLETAEIAIRAALTGHLVFSTLHTNDAPSAFTRLIDMGIEPFLVASSVEAVLAQRLVRLICPHCMTEVDMSGPEQRRMLEAKQFPFDVFPQPTFYKGAGCEECREQGYLGRTGIYELLEVRDNIRPLIMSRAPSTEIREAAIANGMKTLRQAGWYRTQFREPKEDGPPVPEYLRGRPTTMEEVLRVTQTEEHLAALMEDERTTLRSAALSAPSAPAQPAS
ncbi:MAG: type II/IV secretion system protein [Verrucomicrobia bacterium]|nr:MAG: type II/IV secretion system protein [Verrucomicrobiota bacterium]